MPTEILWTALPDGRRGSRLRVSAHVSPRLTTAGGMDGTLADFPVVAAWPPGDLAFEVLFDGGVHRLPATIVSAAPDPTIWQLLFPGTSKVASHAVTDRSQTPIHTYPLVKIAAWLRDRYAQTAIDSGEEFPAIDDLLAAGWDDIRFSGRDGRLRWDQLRQTLERTLDRSRVVDTSAPSSPDFDFVQLEDFFAPVDLDDEAVHAAFEQPVAQPTLDFHAVLQFVNEHPPLLRTVGLVYDLDVDDAAAPIPAGPHTVEIVPISEAFAGVTHRRPRTHCEVTASGFGTRPRPGTTHLAGGFLRFEDTTQFQAVQVEVDGGAIKAADRADNLHRIKQHPTEDTPDTAALPTLRADGISVARIAKAKQLHDTLVLGPTLEGDLAADSLELYAEDVVRGVRVDVLDAASGTWHSLMQRTGRYELDGGNVVLPVADEGFIVANATKKVGSDDLFVTEEVFHWDGWSLVAARPGKVLNIDPADPNPLIDRQNQPGAEFDARFHFDATPGTLPRLRYGREYRLRARTVDLAGNSLPPSTSDASRATPTVRYGRFEPPQTPPVLLRTPTGPGESMETVVLRSNFDVPPAPVQAQRHLVPPKVGQLMAELHGVLDVPDPSNPTRTVLDKSAYSLLEARDAATLADPPAKVDPDGNADSRYYDVDDVPVTWTPDPAMTSLALRLLDGPNAGFLDSYSLYDPAGSQAWPEFAGIRLAVVEGVGAPSFHAGTRVLTVPLRKADIVHARLSGVVDVARLDEHALWGWVLDALPPGPAGAAKEAELLDLIADGQHWMFEPFRTLTLVHATRQPLAAPEFPLPPTASRPPGATFAQLSGKLAFDRRSTERVDLLADWEDPVDDGPDSDQHPAFVGDPEGTRKVERQTAVTVQIEHGDGLHETELQLRHRHEIGDTRHHVVTYRGVASSRFTEYFTSRDTITYDGPGAVVVLDTGAPAAGVLPGSVKLSHTLSEGQVVALVEGRDFTVDTQAGSIAFAAAAIDDLAPGSSLRAAYLVPPFTRETSDPAVEPDEFGPRTISVPSSVRPTAPRVRYVLPAFRWESSDVTDHELLVQRTSTRHGRLLRIYLERPWWSSGVGELLGVVTWPDAESSLQPDLDDEDPLRPFVTQWGEDPIFDQRALSPRYPQLASFPRAVATDAGLTLKELGGATSPPVNVAGHEVGYDPVRGLWYADVEVGAPDAYVPFVRLALARWQPDSIPFQELSPVVLADFVQLAPDRSASVVFDDADRSILGVTLTGPTHHGSEVSGTHPGHAQVLVEQRQHDLSGDLAWKQLGQPIAMNGSVSNGLGQWFAEIHLDEPPVPGQLRLVVEQSERLAEEPLEAPRFSNPNVAVQPIPVDRLLFTDIIPL